MSVVVVGKNSFLAGHLKANPDCAKWNYLTHAELNKRADILADAATVINFSFAPALMKESYDSTHDIDSFLAKSIGKNTHYIMLSSRMVYGEPEQDRAPFSETAPCIPANNYGRNKLAIENSLRTLIPDNRLIILRLSNVFGYEPGRHTFFGIALENLRRNKKMVFDHARETVRDFLPAEIFAERIVRIAKSPQAGTYNMGAGFGLSTGELADTLIKAYGEGTADFTSDQHKGGFYLDINKTNAAFNFDIIDKADVLKYCTERAKRLRQET